MELFLILGCCIIAVTEHDVLDLIGGLHHHEGVKGDTLAQDFIGDFLHPLVELKVAGLLVGPATIHLGLFNLEGHNPALIVNVGKVDHTLAPHAGCSLVLQVLGEVLVCHFKDHGLLGLCMELLVKVLHLVDTLAAGKEGPGCLLRFLGALIPEGVRLITAGALPAIGLLGADKVFLVGANLLVHPHIQHIVILTHSHVATGHFRVVLASNLPGEDVDVLDLASIAELVELEGDTPIVHEALPLGPTLGFCCCSLLLGSLPQVDSGTVDSCHVLLLVVQASSHRGC